MVRSCMCAVVVVAIFALGLTAAEPKKDNKDKAHKAKIVKVDKKNGTITVRMKDKDGKEVTRIFKLTEDIRYFDSTGKVAAIDVFQAGNEVLVVEEEGKLKEIHHPKK